MERAFAGLLPKDKRRPLEYDEVQVVDDILDGARDYAELRLTLAEFSRIGHNHRNEPASYWRFVAMLNTPVEDARRQYLRDAVDDILVSQGYVLTHGPVMTKSEVWDIARTRERLLSSAVEVG